MFYKVIRKLKQKCPADLPVRVRRVKVPKDIDGDCEHRDDHYLIRISNRLPEYAAIEIFLHEFGHALSWHKCLKEDHCDEWGKMYSRIYRVFLKEFFVDD